MSRFGSLKRLRAASVDDIADVPGIGPATAAAIAAAVARPAAAPAVNTATGEILES
jgi:excinuclease ABC subunit C